MRRLNIDPIYLCAGRFFVLGGFADVGGSAKRTPRQNMYTY